MSEEAKRSISRILSRLTEVFERAGIETPRLDAEVLLGFCLGKDRAELYRDLSMELGNDQILRILELAGRRKRREPMAYIRGFREFWSLEFTVTPAVLVPRPETECLVEEVLALRDAYRGEKVRILDIGAGSGAVGIAVASDWPDCEMTATELSAAALEVSHENARKLLGESRAITLVQGDLYEGTEGTFDIVCSNPPYIGEAEYETLAREVTLYEPREALVAGPLGTEVHRRIAEGAREKLKPGGWLLMEMGAEQRAALAKILEQTGLFGEIRFRADLAGLDRVVIARRATLEKISAKDFDRKFDEGDNITQYLDVTKARRPGRDKK
jgi:release factor glutamine methyltransferase